MDNAHALAAERTVLAGIYKYGFDGYVEAAEFIDSKTFVDEAHQIFYQIFEYVIKEKGEKAKIDIASVFSSANDLKVASILEKPEEKKLLRGITNFPVELDSVRHAAGRMRKLQLARLMRVQLKNAHVALGEVTGVEPISQILGIAENTVFDFSSLLKENTGPKLLGDNILDYVEFLASNPTNTVGVSTGMKHYDRSIGGGLRPGTVSIIGGRPKSGKSQISNNVGYHIAAVEGEPTLYLDTEMSNKEHRHRMLANLSNVLVDDIESGAFARNDETYAAVASAATRLSQIPYYYESIVGMPFEDTIALMRRWIRRHTNPKQRPVIIYDYLKLMSTEGMTKDLKEYQLLGFHMTTLHNFMAKYNVACLALIQLNRDGIEKEDTSVASGSDRIIWLCSNFSVFKKKSKTEIAEELAAGLRKSGNRKIVPIVTRFGAGLEDDDYICVQSQYQYGRIIELGTRKSLENPSGFRNEDSDDDGAGAPTF